MRSLVVETVVQREARIATLAVERAARAEGRALPEAGERRAALTRADVPALMVPTTVAGPPVSTRSALEVTDVWAVVSTIAKTASMMPLALYTPAGPGRVRAEGVGADLLRRPAPGFTAAAFVATAVLHVCLHGEVFVAKFRRPDGSIAFLGLLPPETVQVELGTDGEPKYLWSDGQTPHVLGRADIAHGMLFSLDGRRGCSPVRMAREGLGLNRALQRHAAATVANGATPKGVLSVPAGPAGEELVERLEADWAARHEGASNAGRVAVVTGDISWTSVGLSAADTEFMDSRRWSSVEVCRVWGLPPWAIGAPSGDSMTYSNVEQQETVLVKRAVLPHLRPLEEALSGDPELAPGDTYVEAIAEGVMRGDLSGRFTAYETALRAGFMTRDEVRERENLPPLPGAPPEVPA